MTGGVAHDFNDLLMVVLGNLEMLQRRLGPAQQFERYLSSIHRAVERGTRCRDAPQLASSGLRGDIKSARCVTDIRFPGPFVARADHACRLKGGRARSTHNSLDTLPDVKHSCKPDLCCPAVRPCSTSRAAPHMQNVVTGAGSRSSRCKDALSWPDRSRWLSPRFQCRRGISKAHGKTCRSCFSSTW
jgi:hypothetical protein